MIVDNWWFSNLIGSTIAVCLIAGAVIIDTTSYLLLILANLSILVEILPSGSVNLDIFSLLEKTRPYLIISKDDTSDNGDDKTGVIKGKIIVTLAFYIIEGCISILLLPLFVNRCGRRTSFFIVIGLDIFYIVFQIFLGNILQIDLLIFKFFLILYLTFTSEIAEPRYRGMVMTTPIVMACLKFLVDLYYEYYSLMFTLICIVASLPFVIICCEETPHFYLVRGKPEKANMSVLAYRAPEDADLRPIDALIDEQKEFTFCKMLRVPLRFQAVLLTLICFLFEIVGLTIYVWIIKLKFNPDYQDSYPEPFLILICSSYVILPILIDYFDRKMLVFVMICTMAGVEVIWWSLFMIEGGLFLPYLPALLISFLVGSYNIAVTVLLVMLVEITPTRLKPWSLSLALIIAELLAVAVGLAVAIIQIIITALPPFGVALILGSWAFVLFLIINYRDYIVETRNKTLEHIYVEQYE